MCIRDSSHTGIVNLPEALKQAPFIFKSASEVKVSWAGETSQESWWRGADSVKGFLLYSRKVSSEGPFTLCSGFIDVSSPQFVVPMSKPGSYVFKVASYGSNDTVSELSPPSVPVVLFAQAEISANTKRLPVVDRVVEGLVRVYSQSTVILHWKPGESYDRYKAEFREGTLASKANYPDSAWQTYPGASQLESSSVEVVADPVGSFQVIQARLHYLFRVRLIDGSTGEEGPSSPAVELIPGASAPTAPGHAFEEGHRSGRLTVGWSEPEDPGGLPLLKYRVQVFDQQGQAVTRSEHKYRQVEASLDRVDFDREWLTPGQKYSFKVAAYNAAGWGQPSTSSQLITFSVQHSGEEEPEKGAKNILMVAVLGISAMALVMVTTIYVCLKVGKVPAHTYMELQDGVETVFDEDAADPHDMF
eukprot:TRINITY_DN7738_c0_g1_i4.p1 TRINITY_DN7738_c0_g1~~TRINITY_DN7738_c0_g1_i4.p1  ORF type:complete len:417 (+),score=67.70 TRINITY_DN7738_c0_g1_i4:86-1336(+)